MVLPRNTPLHGSLLPADNSLYILKIFHGILDRRRGAFHQIIQNPATFIFSGFPKIENLQWNKDSHEGFILAPSRNFFS